MKNICFLFAMVCAAISGMAGTIVYNHDAAGRLTGVAYDNGKSQTFGYDNAGNLLLNKSTLPGNNPDADGDGLDDAWEQLYFGTLSRDGYGDLDGDGFADRSEFLAGTDPTSAISVLRILQPQHTGGNTTIQWASVPGKTYRVQFKNDLSASAWGDLPGDITASGDTAAKIDNSAPAGRFYRVMLVP